MKIIDDFKYIKKIYLNLNFLILIDEIGKYYYID